MFILNFQNKKSIFIEGLIMTKKHLFEDSEETRGYILENDKGLEDENAQGYGYENEEHFNEEMVKEQEGLKEGHYKSEKDLIKLVNKKINKKKRRFKKKRIDKPNTRRVISKGYLFPFFVKTLTVLSKFIYSFNPRFLSASKKVGFEIQQKTDENQVIFPKNTHSVKDSSTETILDGDVEDSELQEFIENNENKDNLQSIPNDLSSHLKSELGLSDKNKVFEKNSGVTNKLENFFGTFCKATVFFSRKNFKNSQFFKNRQ
eukprot:TRINITY_DN1606_c0_g2_i4.p2 TRINITY_DN1606_c0_g2~~TRINITY_DN1606_c0_g2_i4.p2  ORF type:complete len:260 (-),score=28.30 TRINITY_DN1606_c0_g2_i4:153-932(-)